MTVLVSPAAPSASVRSWAGRVSIVHLTSRPPLSMQIRRTLTLLLVLVLSGAPVPIYAQPAADGPPDTTAVPNGTLMLAGGGIDADLYKTFVRLAGGTDAEIVYVPTAAETVDLDSTRAFVRKNAAQVGASPENMTVLHTRDPEVADTDSFAAPLETADAVWFSGGRQWRLVDAYAGTETLDGFWSVLERGGAIGGSSAGATIQGSFLVRGDTETNEIMMGDHQEGFGFLPQSAVDQHLLARDRQYDLIPVIESHPQLLGIGIAEKTAVVVRGDTLRVVGESKVAIYDHRRWAQGEGERSRNDKFFFLTPGDRFTLDGREVLAPRSQ